MTTARSPRRWATDISSVLNKVLGADHFPIRVADVAQDYSHQIFPSDPITLIKGDALSSFDGALLRAPAGAKGWGIIYNDGITSKGRINFTLAHEFAHYLIHRLAHPEGMRCGQQDLVRWESSYRQLEFEANTFAAYLLMPFDDYRRQIDSRSAVCLDAIAHCADRYEVSLIAATLRWLEFTERRAVLVVSRDGFILWARSSPSAFKTGAFFRTSRGAIPIPEASVAARKLLIESPRDGTELPAGVWFAEQCTEMTIFSENYDFTMSLLQLNSEPRHLYQNDDDDNQSEDLSSVVRRNHGL
jgi:uncharacterized protein DUF955